MHDVNRVSEALLTENGSVERGRVRVVVATILINVVAVALLTLVSGSDWRTGLALNLIDNTLMLGFVVAHRDLVLARLMVFGLVVGIVELAADAWLVDFTHTLDYSPGGGPMLWRSPLWMPFAWEVVTVQLSCLGSWLWQRCGGGAGLLLVGILGAINIPYYEEMARHIHWWNYTGSPMLLHTPWYIILGEFGIAIVLTLLARLLPGRGIVPLLALGLLGGAGIFVCYALAYLAIARLTFA